MSEISTQLVIDAVTRALRAAYPEATIWDDEVDQGISSGAFIVQLINAGQRRIVGPRFHCTPLFDVIYFSDNSGPECIRIADELCQVLVMVETPGGDTLHGTGMEWRVDDHVLHFTVSYSYYIRIDSEKPDMETLQVQIQE